MKTSWIVFGFALWSAAFAGAQQYVISTYAGAPPPPSANTVIYVGSVATDATGDVYFSGYINRCACVFKLDPNGVLSRVAGSEQRGSSGDGGPATSARLSGPAGLAVDGAGNLFIADQSGSYFGSFPNGYSGDRIRKVSPDGIITTVAGGGRLAGSAADGGPATSADLFQAYNVAADNAGNIFISESLDVNNDFGGSNRIRKVSPDGIITTVVGNGMFGFAGDGGPPTSAQLGGPGSLAVDNAGNLFFVDLYNQRIRKVSPDGTITTAVDTSASISRACFCSVSGMAIDSAGNLFYSVYSSGVFKQSPAGVATIVVGADTGLVGWSLSVDNGGNLFLPNGSGLSKVSPDGLITTLLGSDGCCYSGDGGPAAAAQLNHTNSVAADAAGNLFIADTGNHRIRKVTADGRIATIAGGVWSTGCNTMAASSVAVADAQLCSPSQVAIDGAGNVLIVDRNRIRKISPDGTITLVAGDGTIGTAGEGGPATQAQLAYPSSVAVDTAGNVYFAEWARVRKITPDGAITTVAGNGVKMADYRCSPPASPGCMPPIGDNQSATSVPLFGPASAVVDGSENLYFVDGLRIRKISQDGIITTVAGNGGRTGYRGYTGDGALAIDAPLWAPNGVTVDSAGNLYISEPTRVRKVTTDGIINTIAGNGEPGYSGDGGLATNAQLWNPTGLTVDLAGNVYFADSYNNVIRVLRPVH